MDGPLALSSEYSCATLSNHAPSAPLPLPCSSLRSAAICVLTLGAAPACPTATCNAASFWMSAPSSSPCSAPVANAVLTPAMSPTDLGAVTPAVTPCLYAYLETTSAMCVGRIDT